MKSLITYIYIKIKKIIKRTFLLIVQVAIALTNGFTQPLTGNYGVEFNQFMSGSGFGNSSELHVFVSDDKGRRLSLGMYYDTKIRKTGGISTSFLKMLRNYKKNSKPILEPYLFYNFIYRRTTIIKSSISASYVVNVGTYKSMEHHIGVGLRTNIIKHIYLTSEIGYGLYLGSIMRPSKPDPVLNESYGTNGTCALVKLGIGIFF